MRNKTLRKAHEKLQAAVAEIVSGDDWKRMEYRPQSVLRRRLRLRTAKRLLGVRCEPLASADQLLHEIRTGWGVS